MSSTMRSVRKLLLVTSKTALFMALPRAVILTLSDVDREVITGESRQGSA
jgi:hypothetical protein